MTRINRNREAKELRKVFVETLRELMREDERVVVLEADLGGASGTTSLAKDFPKQFIQAGISEANMVGMAAAMSMRGYKPFIHTFAPFSTRRALDQIYLEGAYAKNTLTIYGSDPGVCAAANGGTHNTFEDIAIMRSIPETIIVAPCDDVQFAWAMKDLAKRTGVHYLRGNRKMNPPIYEEGAEFELGKGVVLREGDDVLLLSMGEMLVYALDAAKELESMGVSVEVIDAFSLKPFDTELLLSEAAGKRLLVTFENHSRAGGLGGIVAEAVSEKGLGIPLVRIGTDEQFGQVGDFDGLRETFGLTKENIIKQITDRI